MMAVLLPHGGSISVIFVLADIFCSVILGANCFPLQTDNSSANLLILSKVL